MPSNATITAFYNFSPNTKARASQVQNNFDVFRGHLLPVHPSTSTSADNTYDLGSTNYRWKNGYLNNVFSTATFSNNFYQGQTTSGWRIYNETTTNDGDLYFSYGGNIANVFPKTQGFTLSAATGKIAVSNTITASLANFGGSSSGAFLISGSTVTLSCISGIVELGLMDIGIASSMTAEESYILYGNVVTAGSANVRIAFSMNGNLVSNYYMSMEGNNSGPVSVRIPASSLKSFVSVTQGSNNFSLVVGGLNANSTVTLRARLYSKQIF
jgi:hypothetical protein